MEQLDAKAWRELLIKDPECFNRLIRELPRPERIMFRDADLAGLNLLSADIRYCDLTGADLTGAVIRGLQLVRCRLERSILTDIQLDDDYWMPILKQIQILWRDPEEWNAYRKDANLALMESTDFTRADLGIADLSNMFFISAAFDDANLKSCRLDSVNFTGASMKNVDLNGIEACCLEMDEAILDGAVFDGAKLSFSSMSHASAAGATFAGTQVLNANWRNIKIVDTNFNRSYLKSILLYDSILNHCSFQGARIEDCKFEGAKIEDCNFEGANIEGCHMTV